MSQPAAVTRLTLLPASPPPATGARAAKVRRYRLATVPGARPAGAAADRFAHIRRSYD